MDKRTDRQVPCEQDGTRGRVSGATGSGSETRRQALLAQLRAVETCQLAELAREVARREEAAGRESVPQSQIRAVYLDLRRNHLPALVDADVVSYAEDVGEVTLRQR